MLDYHYIKYYYRLITFSLTRQKESDTDPKAIQQIQYVGQLKNLDDNNAVDAHGKQSMFVFMILEKIKEAQLKFSQGSVTVA